MRYLQELPYVSWAPKVIPYSPYSYCVDHGDPTGLSTVRQEG
jgi:hypothetical protein